jgi:hypothetical protein
MLAKPEVAARGDEAQDERLLGRPEAIGNGYTITGDSAPTWNQVARWLARAAGVKQPRLVHVASETIAAVVPELGPALVRDKAHSMIFDTSKLPALVPEFRTNIRYLLLGAQLTIAWYEAHEEAQ